MATDTIAPIVPNILDFISGAASSSPIKSSNQPTSSYVEPNSPISLDSLLSQTQADSASALFAAGQVKEQLGRANLAAKTKSDSYSTKATAETIISNQAELAAINTQNANRKAATAFGTNLDDTSEIISALGTQMLAAHQKINSLEDTIHSKESVSFLDDPIGWFTSQISVKQDKLDYNHAVRQFNEAESTAGALNAATQTQAVTNNALAQAHTAATMQAKATDIKATADIQAAQAAEQNATLNISAIKAVQDMKSEPLKNSYAIYEKYNSNKAFELSKAHFALQEKAALQTFDAREDKLEDLKLDQAAFDRGARNLNLPRQSAALLRKQMQVKGELGETARLLYFSGSLSESSNSPHISSDSGAAAYLLGKTGGTLGDTQKQLEPIFKSAYADAVKAAGVVQQKVGTPEYIDWVKQHAAAAIDTKAKTYEANITEDPANFYKAASVPAVVGYVKTLQKDPFYLKSLAPANITSSDPNTLISIAAADVRAGKVSINEAIDGIQKFYSAAIAQNNSAKNFTSVGLPIQSSYNTKLLSPNGYSFGYNLNNPADVTQAVTRAVRGSLETDLNQLF